jgi:hypothetical protein
MIRQASQWPVLFDIAIAILDHAKTVTGSDLDWSFGGGTALMLQIDQRESHDIDLFLTDPQLLPFLNPEHQDIALHRQPDSYAGDGVTVLKLAYADLGEIDFICAASITAEPVTRTEVRGQTIALETPAEIIAKKVHYRGRNFQPRDMFDLAAVAEKHGDEHVIAALRDCGADRCQMALAMIERANPDFVAATNAQLMVRDTTRHLVTTAQAISRDILRRSLPAHIG